ncbi:hypothetical protein C8Q80DRAFT_1196876 [Daedaleopsis nitida]|nr:hypothetical protein C8Q80DRAFT_1196876 [Daedaleopsis nitida]
MPTTSRSLTVRLPNAMISRFHGPVRFTVHCSLLFPSARSTRPLTGGVPPYSLTIVPSFASPSTVSIPTEAFENNRGTFRIIMEHEKGSEIVAIMSDGGGFATGGVSPVITVGAQTGTTQCNATESGGDFEFEANERLVQCGMFSFSGYAYAGAHLPVTITGFVPGGSVFILQPGATDTSYNWLVDVATGTTLGFYMQDALGRQGGTTEFMVVQESQDASCLDAQSPASFSNAPSMTSASAAPTATTDPQSASASSKRLQSGALAGVIVGPIGALVAVIALVWYGLRNRRSGGTFPRRPRKEELDLGDGDKVENSAGLRTHSTMRPDHPGTGTPRDPALNPLMGQGAWSPQTSPTTFEFAQSPSSAASSQFSPPVRLDTASIYAASSAYGSGYEPAACARSDTQSSSGAQLKAAQAGVRVLAPPRVILHTDLEDEDELPPPPEEVIELPPQYIERRRAAPRQESSDVATGPGLPATGAPPS